MQIVYIFAKKTLDKFLNKWQNKRKSILFCPLISVYIQSINISSFFSFIVEIF